MTTLPPFQNPFQAWTEAWGKLAAQQAASQSTPGAAAAPFPFMGMPWAGMAGVPATPQPWTYAQPWIEAWTKAAKVATGAEAAAAGTGPVDPMSAARMLWVELPVEVAGRLQRFAAERMQDQQRLATELSAEGAGVNPMMRYSAFLQQTGVAWGTELLEIMELYQEKLLNPSRASSEAPIHYPRAAA